MESLELMLQFELFKEISRSPLKWLKDSEQ